ncbi:MAG TPA: capsule assembly Wzi family protein [Terriglobales bacterium]|nr:capsule assembly Wzi family protein [Terriglobales bacterium]
MRWSVAGPVLSFLLIAFAAQNVQARQVESGAGEGIGTHANGARSGEPKSDAAFDLPLGEDPDDRPIFPLMKHLANDQRWFWTRPLELKKPDVFKAFVPFAGFTGLLIASDSWIAKQVPDKPDQLNRSKTISDYGVYSLLGAAGGAYVWGHLTHNDHLIETGFLAGEAALNSTLAAYAFREMTQRPRPYQGNGNGSFFQGGTSFPSEHSAVAWSVASVVAHEYPGPVTKIMAYSLASAVTLTRVTSKQHFASDAFVGTALGWYFGRRVYRAHHDPEIGGAPWSDPWSDLIESKEEKEKGLRNPANMGSPPVPLDSWVYPLFDRLAALGYLQTAYLGMRPWTRMECARFLEEAGEQLEVEGASGEARKIYEALEEEFAGETARRNGAANVGASLDSIYSRVTQISGPPLRDGYHFGQTLVNDYGRPYGQGFNDISGATAHATAGPFAFYARGEYQHSPASSSDPPSVLQAIANADLTLPVSNAAPGVNRFQLVEGSVSLNLHNTQISFGKQSLWLGPGQAGPLLFSNNAESIVMLKIETVSPYRIPLLSRLLGPVQSEYFIGQLSGQQFEFNSPNLLGPGNISPQPFLDGYKTSFKPTPNLEFGMGVTAQFVGPGLPFTWSNFVRTFYVHSQTGPTSNNNNPGKRLSAFDFSYRVPGLRNWLTVYNDSLVVDEISPIGSSRPTINPGIYMPQVPKLPKLEMRAEGLKEPLTSEFAPGFVYYGQRRYRSGYTNNGDLLGNWIGRAGRGGQGWLTYSFSPRSKLQFEYRLQEVSKDFIGGGRLADYSAQSEMMLTPNAGVSGLVQYEQWRFPTLSPSRQSNVTASIQFTIYPRLRSDK